MGTLVAGASYNRCRGRPVDHQRYHLHELSIRFDTIDDLDASLALLGAEVAVIPRGGLFRAGKAFKQYPQTGGTRTGVLPDFLVGGHAVAAGCALLTRDRGRFRDYFPEIRLITPA